MAEHTLKINAELDTSGLQGRLDQLNQQKQRAPGALKNSGAAIAQQLTKLDRTLANLTRAVNQMAAMQKSIGGVGQASIRPVLMPGRGGMGGPVIVPRMDLKSKTTNLMRDAVASKIRFIRRNTTEIMGGLSAEDRQFLHSVGFDRRPSAAGWKLMMEQDPAFAYRKLFTSVKTVPWTTKLSMLNQAPLAALGLGPRSWRNAQLVRTKTNIPAGLWGAAAGFVAGHALTPVLDHFANDVYKEPTSSGHMWSTIGKHAVAGATGGIATGGAVGAAFGGVGAGPGAILGGLIGGLTGALEGALASMSEVNSDSARTAEEVKRRNEQMRANWKRVAEAMPRVQREIMFRRDSAAVDATVHGGSEKAMLLMRDAIQEQLRGLYARRGEVEDRILAFKTRGGDIRSAGLGQALMKEYGELGADILHNEQNKAVLDAQLDSAWQNRLESVQNAISERRRMKKALESV